MYYELAVKPEATGTLRLSLSLRLRLPVVTPGICTVTVVVEALALAVREEVGDWQVTVLGFVLLRA